MKKIFVCSKLRGDIDHNIKKAKEYCRYVVSKGYIPIAPHVYFTQFLDENNEDDRKLGMKMGLCLMSFCDELWIFDDVSDGMQKEIEHWDIIKDKSSIDNLSFLFKSIHHEQI